MICPHCQTTIAENARFCPACGRRIDPTKMVTIYPTKPLSQSSVTSPTTVPLAGAPPTPPPMSATPRRPHRRNRFFALALVTVALLIVATAIGGVFIIQRQARQRTGQWRQVHLSSGQAVPTAPPGAYVFVSISEASIYRPPVRPPISTTWRPAQDASAGYSLDVPDNWTSPATMPSTFALPGGATFCPPNGSLDTTQPGLPPCVSYGNMPSFTPPTTDASMSPISRVNVRGGTASVYTRSALGALVVAYVHDRTGDFVLIANADSDAAMYAFQHMLTSLTLS